MAVNFKFDINSLKKPSLWAVAIPIILTIWALAATAAMFAQREKALDKKHTADTTQKKAQQILALRKTLGANLAGSSSKNFQGIISARLCAKFATIAENRLTRAESPRPQLQKDGSTLHRENYRINNIRLIQIVKFIDYAERNFFSVSCNQLTITPVRSKTKDSWDATIHIQYLVK